MTKKELESKIELLENRIERIAAIQEMQTRLINDIAETNKILVNYLKMSVRPTPEDSIKAFTQ